MVKSVLPVRGVTIGAGGVGVGACQEINVESSQTRRNTHTHTCCSSTYTTHSQRFERETTRSGAAHNMGLMRHSRTALLAVFHTPAHTHMHVEISLGAQSHSSSSFFFSSFA